LRPFGTALGALAANPRATLWAACNAWIACEARVSAPWLCLAASVACWAAAVAASLAIVGAEYVLRWLPRGTHEWSKFVTPAELERYLGDVNLTVTEQAGVVYNPLADKWTVSTDMDVNYMVVAEEV
jgi:hypothetical protein